jgi:hypothetical protein
MGLAPMRLHRLPGGSTPTTHHVVLVEPTGALPGGGQPLTCGRRWLGAPAVARSRRTNLGLSDQLSQERFRCSGDDLDNEGLRVTLDGWGYRFLVVET